MLRCLYFGTDHFSARVLQGVLSNYTNKKNGVIGKLDVVCPPQKVQKIKGMSVIKPCPVETFASNNKLNVFYYDEVKHNLVRTACPYDLGVVVSFGYLLPSRLIRWFPRKCINVHPSLLPRYRGAAPIYHTVVNGDTIGGCTVLELSENKYDCGPVLLQKECRISPTVTTELLSCQMADLGVDMLLQVLSSLNHYQKNKQTQNNSLTISAPKISKEMGFVNFETWTAEYCDHVYRAIGKEYGVWVQYGTKKVKLVEISNTKGSVTTNGGNIPTGMLIYDHHSQLLNLHFKQGYVSVSKLQVATKRVTTAREFYNGYMTSSQLDNSKVLLKSINCDI